MRIPGQTTSRPPPAIFKVDVSYSASSLLVPFAFLTAIISNLARSSLLQISSLPQCVWSLLCSCTRACIGEPLSWSRYDRGLNTNYVSVRLFCGFAHYRSYRNALLYRAPGFPRFLLYFLHLWHYTDVVYYFVSILLFPYDWINTIRNVTIPIRERIMLKFKYVSVWLQIEQLLS